jgi:hypothetical protein
MNDAGYLGTVRQGENKKKEAGNILLLFEHNLAHHHFTSAEACSSDEGFALTAFVTASDA